MYEKKFIVNDKKNNFFEGCSKTKTSNFRSINIINISKIKIVFMLTEKTKRI